MTKQRIQGFTLIELSIVLVIIGLIAGGILVGQTLVSAAAVRATIAQIEKYNTAVNTFRGKYGGIPGDLSAGLVAQFGFTVVPSRSGVRGRGTATAFSKDMIIPDRMHIPAPLRTTAISQVNPIFSGKICRPIRT